MTKIRSRDLDNHCLDHGGGDTESAHNIVLFTLGKIARERGGFESCRRPFRGEIEKDSSLRLHVNLLHHM